MDTTDFASNPESDGIHVESNSCRRGRLSIRKRLLFSIVMLILSVGLLEITSFVVWMLFPPVTLAYLADHLKQVAVSGRDRRNNLEALHPYLGWVFDPDIVGKVNSDDNTLTANSLGFMDPGPSIRKRRPDQFIIGVFGGSVAQQMTIIGETAFRQRLSACPELQGRDIQIVRLGMAGYKQPQQLMALNYVLALGAEFDLVVNIDGYNETGLAVGDNARADLFLAYPRDWDVRLQDVVDPRTTSISYRLLDTRATRQAWARWLIQSPLRHSWTVSLIWAERDCGLKRQQLNLADELLKHRNQNGYGFVHQGPKQKYSTREELLEDAAMLWMNSSLQMHHLCIGRGIRYLHILQPNQYHAGSKPLSSVERERYYTPDQDCAKAVAQCYPLLLEAGLRLQAAGVSFHDLTQRFSNVTETIYCDYFCHYNQRGNELFADAVAERIANELANRNDSTR